MPAAERVQAPPDGAVLNHAIITADDRTRVLAVESERGWALPHVVTTSGRWYDVQDLVEGLQSAYGVRTFVLRCISGATNARESRERVYACEALDGPHGGGSWFDPADGFVLADPTQQAALDAHLSARAVEPWASEGWIEQARAFVAAATSCAAPRLQQLRSWQRSCVLRVDTGNDRLLFKAAPRMYGHEPDLAVWLARRFPTRFPEVVASDRQRGWILMRELTGMPLDRIGDVALWRDALSTFARIQIDSIRATDELLRIGCPDLRIPALRAHTARLLADDDAMLPGDRDGLSEREIAVLQGRADQIDGMWVTLEGFGLPAAFEHGDFRPEHVIVGASGPAYFDVSNGAVSHPFFSAVTMLDFEPLTVEAPAPAVRADLRSAYLEPWASAYGEAALARAFEVARPLAILHAALTRYRLLGQLVPRDDWAFMVPYWLRMLVPSLEQVSS